jgi:molybdopterin molybdotransferase
MALISVNEALERILKGAAPSKVETVKLGEGLGRILAKAVIAKRDQPPFNSSAMDGYAVRFEDVELTPARLTLIGVAAAGHAYNRTLRKGQAVRILTGAPVPRNADTVVIQENCAVQENHVTIVEAPTRGKNIRLKGLDFTSGERLIDKDTRMHARHLGLAAAANAPVLQVYKKPRIALLTTGDELVTPGGKPQADQIVSSNNTALQAMFESYGAEVINLGIVRDNLRQLTKVVARGLKADVLVTTGGASVGDHDYVQHALRKAGVKIDFWKIALRPGKPLMFGMFGKKRVIGLPGNPVSAIVCSRILIKPLIEKLQGCASEDFEELAVLATSMGANDNRQDYVRANLSVASNGLRTATPFAKQDSSMQFALSKAQCLIVRAPHAPAVEAGEQVPIIILDV